MEKPTPPADYECCESGCEPCVWDIYYAERDKWQKHEATLKEIILEEDQSVESD